MGIDILFLAGYLFLILCLWLSPIIRKFFIGHKPELFTLSSGYVFLLADIKSNSNNIVIFNKSWIEINNWLLIIGVLLGLISIVLTYKSKKEQERLQNLADNLNKTYDKLKKIKEEYFKLCSDNIREIFSDFFDGSNGNGRVSIYKHEGTHFVLLGRYSNNPIYNKSGQDTYADDEGFIAEGWKNGVFEIHGSPNWTGKSGTEYKKFMKDNCNITDERLKRITMRSCSFYVYRVNNNDARNPHGIIVFEQMQNSQIPTDTITRIFESHQRQIIFLMKSMKSLN